MNLKDILEKISVLNYDNGERFTKRDRLDAIRNILDNTNYKKVNDSGLFEMYALNGVLPQNPVVVSTHVDCVTTITKCFSEDCGEEYVKGTYDNLITNAIIVHLMARQKLNENVVVAFTGDEEYNSRGSLDVIKFMKRNNRDFSAVILDVTDMGWNENAMFSVENNFWKDSFGQKVIGICNASPCDWVFVPSDVDDIPDYVPKNRIIHEEALCDESWEYDESDIECFSLCIPSFGEMHDNSGLLIRKKSIESYTKILADILNGII